MGMTELILVLAIVVLFFGAKSLPAIGEGLGKAIRNLRTGAQGEDGGKKPPPPKRLPRGPEGPGAA
jgi:sec-independent protein translocase protein TatA